MVIERLIGPVLFGCAGLAQVALAIHVLATGRVPAVLVRGGWNSQAARHAATALVLFGTATALLGGSDLLAFLPGLGVSGLGLLCLIAAILTVHRGRTSTQRSHSG